MLASLILMIILLLLLLYTVHPPTIAFVNNQWDNTRQQWNENKKLRPKMQKLRFVNNLECEGSSVLFPDIHDTLKKSHSTSLFQHSDEQRQFIEQGRDKIIPIDKNTSWCWY